MFLAFDLTRAAMSILLIAVAKNLLHTRSAGHLSRQSDVLRQAVVIPWRHSPNLRRIAQCQSFLSCEVTQAFKDFDS